MVTLQKLQDQIYTPLEDRLQKTEPAELGKWTNEHAVETALSTIDRFFRKTSIGLRTAIKTGDRATQIELVGKLIQRKSILDYMYKHGLRRMMDYFTDATGKNGLKKKGSALAVLEFYSQKKELDWFDRNQDTYLQKWRINKKGMWMGEEGQRNALDAIADFLYDTIPNYKIAEQTSNRIDQVKLINKAVARGTLRSDAARSYGLRGLLSEFRDPDGEHGLKRGGILGMLEYYSKKKNLHWFKKGPGGYVQRWRIEHAGMWKSGEQSVPIALEAIEDALQQIVPSFNTEDKFTAIEHAWVGRIGLTKEFQHFGLRGLLDNFLDSEGKTGLRDRSGVSVIQFYAERNGYDWFSSHRDRYFFNLQGRLRVKENN